MKTCRICGDSFRAQSSFQKYCSPTCYNKGRAKKPSTCVECGEVFVARGHAPTKHCSPKCYSIGMAKIRMGKKNPAYRNGFAVKGKRTYVGAHLRACSKYRKAYLAEHSFQRCEICGTWEALKFEVHHIYFASLYPRHKHLHDFKNLILLCITCHNKMHAGRKENEHFLRLEKERGLKKLFAS